MKLRAILYAIFIALLPVTAAECSTLEFVRKEVAKNPIATIKELNKKETEAFLGVYNSLPPQTNRRGDYSVMISRSDLPTVIYVYFLGNCAIETLPMLRDFFDEVFKRALPELEGQKA